jgi:hypothetical protein
MVAGSRGTFVAPCDPRVPEVWPLFVDDFDVGEIIIGHFVFEIVVLKFGVRDVVGGTCSWRRGHDREQMVAMELDTTVRWK